MEWYYIVFIIIITIIILFFSLTYFCFILTFHVNRKKEKKQDEFKLPPGNVYLPFKETIINAMKDAKKRESKDFYTTSFDGLKLHGKYYECNKGGIIEIIFHGYRGNALRDLSNGIERCFALNHNALIIDQRTSGESEGNVISFGINERKDCLTWINYVINTFGENTKIIITGISMGAATVLMASGMKLPDNVIGVLADSGYDSPKNIIKKVIKQLKLPANIFYPFIKLSAKLFGKFNLEETSPLDGVKNSKIPIIFFHGDIDNFVPCYMSQNLFNECNSTKKLVLIPNAGHGLCYLVDKDKYINELKDFF